MHTQPALPSPSKLLGSRAPGYSMLWTLADWKQNPHSGFEVTGYGTRRNFTQPFAAQDIILLYDGFCASTCSLFSEFLRTQAGVRSVTFGGRPDLDANGEIPIIQNYGGVKGASLVSFPLFFLVS